MQSALYVSLSAQVALENRLTTIAGNVANLGTTGFRADGVKFDTFLSRAASDPVAFASAGKTYISREKGALKQTGNDLDVAVDGEGWLAVETSSGIAYTRDGRMRIAADGMLQSAAGNAVLDPGGAAIIVDPNAGRISISRDGMISQNGRQVGALGLFSIAENATLSRRDNSGVVPDRPAAPVVDFVGQGVAQGYVEESNVNPVEEMVHLIEVQRTFEQVSASIDKSEQSLQDAIQKLGQVS
jgi:flagellar basal-body rod protein FlgF